MITSKTPLRVSFSGGGTDLRSFYAKNEFGSVVSASIDSYLYVSVKKHNPLFNGEYRLNYSETELVVDIEDIKNPIIRETLKFLDIDDKMYISTIADAPASSGLGSSSTFCVGLLNALYKYRGEVVSADRLAEEAAHIECDILKRPMGKQDHYAAAYGGINYIQFNDDESVSVRPLCISAKKMKKLSKSIMMFWTGVSRPSELILAEQNNRSDINQEILLKMREQSIDLTTILNDESFSVKNFGSVVGKGWEYKKTLSSEVTNSSINDWYETAIEVGAYGGKISGAGGGGFLTIIADQSSHKALAYSLEKKGLKRYKFGFDTSGTTVYQIE